MGFPDGIPVPGLLSISRSLSSLSQLLEEMGMGHGIAVYFPFKIFGNSYVLQATYKHPDYLDVF